MTNAQTNGFRSCGRGLVRRRARDRCPGHPPSESAVGAGTLGQFGTPTGYLGAIGNQRGPLGAFTITYPDGTYVTGTSNCLVVDGKTAYVTGKIVLSGGPCRDTSKQLPGDRRRLTHAPALTPP